MNSDEKLRNAAALLGFVGQKALDRLDREQQHAVSSAIADLEGLTGPPGDAEKLRDALVEIDTYLAHDPDVWRLNSVAKAGDVLCDVLGAETVQRINASVKANLCAKCHGVSA